MIQRLLTLLFVVLVCSPAGAAPLGWFTWTNTGAATTTSFAGQWEDSPTGGEDINLGDNRIRQLKFNIRLRANTEACWDATTTTGCYSGDSGRSRAGSSRVFLQNSSPTTLSTSDANGSSVLDSGRLYVDEDGPDNSAGATDDNRSLYVYASGSWQMPLAMGRAGTTTNTFKLWDGSSWANALPATTTVVTGTNADATGTAVPTALTVLTGATGTAVIPPTGSYLIHVLGEINIAAASTSVYVGLKEYDGTTTTVVKSCWIGGLANVVSQCNLNYVKDAPTLSLTYTYTVEIQAAAAGATYNAQQGALAGFGTGTPVPRAQLQVVRVSKTLPRGF